MSLKIICSQVAGFRIKLHSHFVAIYSIPVSLSFVFSNSTINISKLLVSVAEIFIFLFGFMHLFYVLLIIHAFALSICFCFIFNSLEENACKSLQRTFWAVSNFKSSLTLSGHIPTLCHKLYMPIGL